MYTVHPLNKIMYRWRFFYCKVGGSSKADVRRKKKIVTNALNAAKAAMDEGILPGKPCILESVLGPSCLD